MNTCEGCAYYINKDCVNGNVSDTRPLSHNCSHYVSKYPNHPKTCKFYASGPGKIPLCDSPNHPHTDCEGTDCGLYSPIEETQDMFKPKKCKFFYTDDQGLPSCTSLECSFHECAGVDCGYYSPLDDDLSLADDINLGDSLNEAHKIITGYRQDQYGKPEDSFTLIAEYWNVYLTKVLVDKLSHESLLVLEDIASVLTPKDIAHMMILFKVARCNCQSHSRDNYLDIQGYAAIAADRLQSQL